MRSRSRLFQPRMNEGLRFSLLCMNVFSNKLYATGRWGDVFTFFCKFYALGPNEVLLKHMRGHATCPQLYSLSGGRVK